ncbi:MAG: hypothetical protein NVS4B1_24180 [Ktedonobacteraceae bacterium]
MLSSTHVAHLGGGVGMLYGVIAIGHGLFLILLQPRYWAPSSYFDYLSIALMSIGMLLLMGGLIGLHARLNGCCGKLQWLEKIGFFMAASGAAVAAISNVTANDFSIPLMGQVLTTSIFSLLIGILLAATATLLANVRPRRYGWAPLVGLFALLLNDHLFPDGGGLVLFGLVWLVLGYALWKEQAGVSVPSKLARD